MPPLSTLERVTVVMEHVAPVLVDAGAIRGMATTPSLVSSVIPIPRSMGHNDINAKSQAKI